MLEKWKVYKGSYWLSQSRYLAHLMAWIIDELNDEYKNQNKPKSN